VGNDTTGAFVATAPSAAGPFLSIDLNAVFDAVLSSFFEPVSGLWLIGGIQSSAATMARP
jgi:hypothetical protein